MMVFLLLNKKVVSGVAFECWR